MSTSRKPSVSFGPEAPEFGSWNWIGADLSQALRHDFDIQTFRNEVPECDVVVFIKFKPPAATMSQLAKRSQLIFCPVDIYGSAAEIDGDGQALRNCSRIVIHCERLGKYFSTYAPVIYLDHPIKFAARPPVARRLEGPILWIGNRSNIAPVAAWVNAHPLPDDLWILTDLEQDATTASRLGFVGGSDIRVGRWSADRHIEWTGLARAALDVKGTDFRARHKPPAKALDFLASGLPLAMNSESSSVEHLARRGFRLATLDDRDYWLSAEYWRQVQTVAGSLRSDLSLPCICARFRRVVEEMLAGAG